MDLKMVTSSDKMWNKVRDYAKSCSWNAGKSLANAMNNNLFTEWERIIIALDNQKICGYLFVGEEFRGNRLSQKLIQYAMDYLKSIGFDRVHIVTAHLDILMEGLEDPMSCDGGRNRGDEDRWNE